jgi:hypothetical protein
MHDFCILRDFIGRNDFAFIAASSPNNFNADRAEFSLASELHPQFQI